MAKDPYKIEKEVNGFISDRKDWMVGKNFSSLNRDAFEFKMQEKYAYFYHKIFSSHCQVCK